MINKGTWYCHTDLEYREWLLGMVAQGAMANPQFATASAESIAAMCVEQTNALLKVYDEGDGGYVESPGED